jgi:hypothetical protein
MLETHWDLKPGDRVWVNGSGSGTIEELHEDPCPSCDWVRVRLDTYECRCDCGDIHEKSRTVTIHPINTHKKEI